MKKIICITFAALLMTFAMTGCDGNNGKIGEGHNGTVNDHTKAATTPNATTPATTNAMEPTKGNVVSSVGSALEEAATNIASGAEDIKEDIMGTTP